MARTLIVVRTTLGWEDVGVVRDYFREMQAVLQNVPGYLGGGAWQGVQDVYARLVIYAYESPDATERGLVAASELRALGERIGPTSLPADALRLQVERSDGVFASGVPTDVLLSLSSRVAEPGYGPDAVDDFENDFGGLSMVEGYAGMVVGTRMGMADEVVGITAWRTAEGLVASMPETQPTDVAFYEPLEEA